MTTDPTPSQDVAPWSTVTLRCKRTPGVTRDDLAQLSDTLDAIGGVLADLDAVGGTELRDASTFDGPERPELVIYTTPEACESVQSEAVRVADRHGLGQRVEVVAETHTDDSWRDGWKDFYQKLRFGHGTLLVRPSWLEREADDPSCEVVLDPGRAFGTGRHETTHLCLDALVERVESSAPELERVLDLGCGSGILAIAAARLLPEARVVAIDNDPEATETTRENAALNQLEARLEVITGQSDDAAHGGFDLVLANIRPAVLIPQAERITACLDADGHGVLVLSGILDIERDGVREAYLAQGLTELRPPLQRGEWVALVMTRA